MTYSYPDRQMWLHDLAAEVGAFEGVVLCAAHADGRTPPVGWTLADQRVDERHLFAAVAVA